MIRDISKETGVTSVVISHDMASTFRIADRISMLYEGKIAISATPDEFKRSTLPFVREFVEMSGTVTFEKHYEIDDEDTTTPGDS
jgi:phospholipid/cholesterol/gamma-HCH transport system ATP-binding protein